MATGETTHTRCTCETLFQIPQPQCYVIHSGQISAKSTPTHDTNIQMQGVNATCAGIYKINWNVVNVFLLFCFTESNMRQDAPARYYQTFCHSCANVQLPNLLPLSRALFLGCLSLRRSLRCWLCHDRHPLHQRCTRACRFKKLDEVKTLYVTRVLHHRDSHTGNLHEFEFDICVFFCVCCRHPKNGVTLAFSSHSSTRASVG